MVQKFFEQLPIDEIYKDLFQPGMKKAGEALATVVDGANLILLPLKLLNEKSRIYFKKNIELYSDKINKVEDLTLIQVPQYVGLPVIDKLTYLNQGDLANAFINLLSKASFEETLVFVHPAYIDILNRMSADEAIILSQIKDEECIPYIDINVRKNRKISDSETGINALRQKTEALMDNNCGDFELIKYLTGMEKDLNLNYPNNINIYLENLMLNGLLFYKKSYNRERVSVYQKLEEQYKEDIDNATLIINELYEKETKYKAEIIIQYGELRFTELGKGFLKVCIQDISENPIDQK
ncbi:Abi-alpha family protein [uncultured Dysgonomonas sp.]|uniref:DUF4393 domain-containing protein n=1 Tax=uncultured Dysgonomonas sp. TaxID=206096 RepID=A0A212J413_9BACT|nr:Abi-alpha family protein [uncultured Dysgonomonas sp.]SBV94196.1 conserved hypothetical protein [uncultured Dysgonomonas sp.]